MRRGSRCCRLRGWGRAAILLAASILVALPHSCSAITFPCIAPLLGAPPQYYPISSGVNPIDVPTICIVATPLWALSLPPSLPPSLVRIADVACRPDHPVCALEGAISSEEPDAG
jgi:hypothetical protein